MARVIKWLLIILVLLLIIAAVAVYGAIHYAKSDKFKTDIIAQVKEETGRDLSIDGDLNLSFYPWAGVDLQKISLSNPAGFKDQPFLKADKLALRIKTMPLLKEQYELDTLRVHGLELNLEKNKDGVTNWQDFAGDDKHRDHDGGDAVGVAGVILGGVDIKDGKVSWSDATTGQDVVVSDITATTGELNFGDPIELVASLKAKSNQPAISSDVKLNGTLEYDLDKEVYSAKPFALVSTLKGKNIPGGQADVKLNTALVVDMDNESISLEGLDLNALGTQLKATLNADDVDDDPVVNGELSLKGESLARLFKVLELEPMASDLAKQKSTDFAITSSITADVEKETFSLPDFKANLLGTEVNANITANDVHEEAPSAKGTINAKGSNLPIILKLLGQFQGKDSALIGLANDLAKNKNKSFNISTEFDADLEDGTAEIPKLNAQLVGADIQAKLSAHNLNDDNPDMKGQLQAKGPDLPSLMQLVGNLQGKDSALLGLGQQLSKSSNKAFDVDTTFDLNPGKGKMDISKLNANALGLAIDGNMSSQNNAMDGKLKVSGKDIKGLLSAVGQADLAQVMKALDIDVGIKGKQDDFQLSPFKLDATLAGKQIPNSPVHLVMTGDTRANLKKQTASVKDLSVKGLGLNLKGNINVSDLDKDSKFSGDVAVTPFNLRSFLKQLNQPIPKTADKNVLKNFAISSQISGSNNSLKLDGLKMTLDDTKLQGDINIQNFAKPAVTFGVGIDTFNADRYLPPETTAKATPESAAAGAATLPIDTLRDLNINGDLLIGKLVYSNLKLNDVKLSLKAKDGLLQFSPASALLYEGKYQGDISLNAQGKTPKLNMKTQFNDIVVEPLLTDLTGEASVTGKGNISLNMTSSGADVSTLQHTLAGQGEFALVDGIFKGVDVPKILQDVEIKIENKDILGLKNIPQGGETPFDSVTGTLQINSGVIRNEDLMLKAPGFEVAGNGTVMNLADQTWKYNLVVEASEERLEQGEQSYNVGGHKIPVACRGKIADQNCKPDAGKIIAAVGSKQVERELGKFLDKLSGKEEAPAETAPSAEVPAEGAPATGAEAPAQPEAAPEPEKKPVDKLLDKALDKLF